MKQTKEISNNDDLIDSRDVIARIEYLESEQESFEGTDTEWEESEEGAELKALKALSDEADGSPDWPYGETLIRDSYFVEYAEDLARDISDMKQATDWPFRHIDWESAADELKGDYLRVDFDDVEYWIRA